MITRKPFILQEEGETPATGGEETPETPEEEKKEEKEGEEEGEESTE